jgi:plasmid rolling circle replication initiator protein Rep
MFKNRVLINMMRPQLGEATGEWENLYNKKLHDLYCSPKYYASNQIKNNEMGRTRGT